jgi:hypothetical protein
MGDSLTPATRQETTKSGVRALGGIGGAIALGIVQMLSQGVFGIVIGGVSALLGLSALKSESKADKMGGIIALGAGIFVGVPALLGLLGVGFLGQFTGFIMGAGGLALLGYGIFNLVKFIKGMQAQK